MIDRDLRWLQGSWLHDIFGASKTELLELLDDVGPDQRWLHVTRLDSRSVLLEYQSIAEDQSARLCVARSLDAGWTASPSKTWVWDAQEDVLYIDAALAARHGLQATRQRLSAAGLAATFHPDERADFLKALKAASFMTHARISLPDGQTRPVTLRGQPYGAGGRWVICATLEPESITS